MKEDRGTTKHANELSEDNPVLALERWGIDVAVLRSKLRKKVAANPAI